MNGIEQIFTGGGVIGVLAAAWAFLRSESGRRLIGRIKGTIMTEARSLREAVDNLAQVVEAQGESIEWLRGELTRTRAELDEARVALTQKESNLAKENEKLRKRVAELEAQVRALEAALASRTRRTTTKKEVK